MRRPMPVSLAAIKFTSDTVEVYARTVLESTPEMREASKRRLEDERHKLCALVAEWLEQQGVCA